MKLKNLVKACSKDKFRPNLCNVNLRRKDQKIICEATDRNVLIQVRFPEKTAPKPLAALKDGQYTASDWTDLICKERVAEPVADATPFPDWERVIPALSAYKASAGCKAFGFDPRLVAVVASVLDVQGFEIMMIDARTPIRIDHEDTDYIGCEVTAIIAPFR